MPLHTHTHTSPSPINNHLHFLLPKSHSPHPHSPMADSNPPQPPPTTIKPPPSSDHKPLLPQATYIIQIPKDQIYRIPPPENTQKLLKLSNRKPKRSPFCRCFCYTISLIFILLILLSITVGILYLTFRPEKLKYSINNISITGINLTSSVPLYPKINVSMRFENPNDKLTVFYGKGGYVNVGYGDVKLCDGELTAFEQRANNVTVVKTVLRRENNIVLAREVHARLVRQERERRVPLKVTVKVPVKVKVGVVKTWEVKVKVKCDVDVDRLVQKSKIVGKSCGYTVDLW